MKFHVTYNESKKLLDVKLGDLVFIKRAVNGLWTNCDFRHALIQWYMPEINDWIDLDDKLLSQWSENDESIRKIRVRFK